jgi:hypothetical protein
VQQAAAGSRQQTPAAAARLMKPLHVCPSAEVAAAPCYCTKQRLVGCTPQVKMTSPPRRCCALACPMLLHRKTCCAAEDRCECLMRVHVVMLWLRAAQQGPGRLCRAAVPHLHQPGA